MYTIQNSEGVFGLPSVSFCRRQFQELVQDVHRAATINDPALMGDYLDSLISAGRDYQEAVQSQANHQAEVRARLPRTPDTIEQMAQDGRLPVLVGGESPDD